MYVLTCADGHEGEDDSADDEGDEVDGEVLSLEVEPRLFLEVASQRRVKELRGAGQGLLVLVAAGIVVLMVDFFLLDGRDVRDEAEEQKLQDERQSLFTMVKAPSWGLACHFILNKRRFVKQDSDIGAVSLRAEEAKEALIRWESG